MPQVPLGGHLVCVRQRQQLRFAVNAPDHCHADGPTIRVEAVAHYNARMSGQIRECRVQVQHTPRHSGSRYPRTSRANREEVHINLSHLPLHGLHQQHAGPCRLQIFDCGNEPARPITVNGTPIEVGPRQALCIPRGAVHRFDNFGSEGAKQLAVVSPAIMGPAYFREAAELIGAATGGPPDPAKMIEFFRRHGMTVAPVPAK